MLCELVLCGDICQFPPQNAVSAGVQFSAALRAAALLLWQFVQDLFHRKTGKKPLPAFRSAFSSGRERMLLKEFLAPFRVKKLQTGKAAPAALRFSRWSVRRRGRSAAEAAASASRSAGAALRSPDPFCAVNPAIVRPHSYLFSCSNYTIKPQKTQCFLRFCTYFLSSIGTMDLLRRY